ncbi:hypothetical protein ACHAWF_000292, partial [Thalassiosira exigua]
MMSTLPGFVVQMMGKLTKRRCTGATAFVDHFFKTQVRVHHGIQLHQAMRPSVPRRPLSALPEIIESPFATTMPTLDVLRTTPSFSTAASPINRFPSVALMLISRLVLLRKLSTISQRLRASSSCLPRLVGQRLPTCLCGPMHFAKRPAMTPCASKRWMIVQARPLLEPTCLPVGNLSSAGTVELDLGSILASLLPTYATSPLCSVSRRGWYLLS